MKKIDKKEVISDLAVIAIAVIVFYLISKFLAMPISVHGTSMENTIKENSAGLSFYYDLDNIERFDIVVVDTNQDKLLFKRVIGLPNETIEYKNNKLFVDGKEVKEEFLDTSTYTGDYSISLKDNEYFCLGDNREVSNDSRYYGTFKKEDIVSSHVFLIYPFNRIGFYK